MKYEDLEYERSAKCETPSTPTTSTAESGIDLKDSPTYSEKPSDDIQVNFYSKCLNSTIIFDPLFPIENDFKCVEL